MQLSGQQMPFGREDRRSGLRRMGGWLILIGLGLLVLYLRYVTRDIQPLFLPDPTPTRTAQSFAEEGKTYFSAGDLARAIEAYQQAVALVPEDSQLLAELARIQTYYSAQLASAAERAAQLTEARASADAAVAANPDSAYAHAIRAFAYDWSATEETGATREGFLTEGLNAAVRASQLATPNTSIWALAAAFQAEVLVDQQRFVEAQDKVSTAVALAPDSMDVHRVAGAVWQSTALYRQSIDEYLLAAEINPNLTFLYIQIGANYRRLEDEEAALEYFDRAVRINKQLGIQDPGPYQAIARTYMQMGEFFIAARNMEKALLIDEGNAGYWGLLGVVYYRARNYESSEQVLRCAVDGCSAEETRVRICELNIAACDPDDPNDPVGLQHGQEIAGQSLSDSSLEAYYTYGSVLAYNGKCDEAERILQALADAYAGDPTIMQIVVDNRDLCAASAAAGAEATPKPSPTP
ncbi:MAG: tetratricopeptide repeat protein [Chloroflexi bacterium]|nr:tetratricopeptide repeat protein [Chloroflexota bacterium]